MLVSNFYVGHSRYHSYHASGMNQTISYTLQITNLAPITVEFDVECRITGYGFNAPPNQAVLTSLNYLMGGGWGWHTDAKGHYTQGTITIRGNSAQIVRLQAQSLPWPYGAGADWSTGYIILRVPVIRGRQPPYTLIPQTKKPVPVLLSATGDERWTYGGEIPAVSHSSLPLATGKAFNEIPPETQPSYTHPLAVAGYVDDLVGGEVKVLPARGAIGLPDEDRAQALIDLLRQMEGDEASIAALSRMLEGSESPVRVGASDSKPSP